MIALIQRAWAWYTNSVLAHPKATFTSLVVGLVSMSHDPNDFSTIFGDTFGPKIAVILKWVGYICISHAAAGASVFGGKED
jgi:hypothetical protein